MPDKTFTCHPTLCFSFSIFSPLPSVFYLGSLIFSGSLSKLHYVAIFNKQTTGLSVSAQVSSSWVTLDKPLTAITLFHLQSESKMLLVALVLWVIQRGIYLQGLLTKGFYTLIQWFNKHV